MKSSFCLSLASPSSLGGSLVAVVGSVVFADVSVASGTVVVAKRLSL